MFNFGEYLMKGFRNAIGKQDDYQIIMNSAGWKEKGILTDDNLSELNNLIDAKNAVDDNEDVVESEVN